MLGSLGMLGQVPNSNLIPYVGFTTYVGASVKLQDSKSNRISLKFDNQVYSYTNESYKQDMFKILEISPCKSYKLTCQ